MVAKSSPPTSEKKKRARRILKALKRLFPDAKMILRHSSQWELLVAVELSAQCTDKQVNRVTEKLFKKYRTLDDYVKASASRRSVRAFEADIYATGFYRNKAKNILAAAQLVKEQYKGKLPKTMDGMLAIPGVGRKTANILLGNAYGIVEGIAVDTHVYRLAHALGLSGAKSAEKVEQDLMALFPKKDWFRLTYMLIEYGRTYCTARRHDHANCPLSRVVAVKKTSRKG